RVYSSLNVNRCNGGSVRNNNGYLICSNGYGENGNGNGYDNGNGHHHHHHNYNGNNNYNGNGYNNGYGYNNALPPGSYQASCTNIRMNGSTLSASCTAGNGQRVYSSINVNACQSRGMPIRNNNGYLRC
ncbi:MAG TPA: CVNH domain-containing protein, partial [Candidatus Baltobacteraceae bacterium]|nr:CVNH domain-containing protein [Candidatus Baltobacteraceae bacterium]